jgi:sugar diacid utilization regulator
VGEMSEQNQQIKILCELSKANSLQKVADLTFHLIGNPIFISDMAHTMLAYTQCVNVPHVSWQKHVVGAQMERNILRQEREVSTVQGTSANNRLPVVVDDDDVPFPRIIKTLVADGRSIGMIVLTSYFQPLGEDDIELMELISAFVVPLMKREHFISSGGNRTVENFFIQMLEGTPVPRERVNKRLDILGWKKSSYFYILALCFEQDSEAGPDSLQPILQSFSSPPHCCAFLYNNSIVCIYSASEEVQNWETMHLALNQLLEHWKLIAGVSRHFEDMSELREHYLEAVYALEIGRALERKFRFYVYDSFSVFHMFRELPAGSVMRYCNQRIRDLDEYDRTHNAQLCITLQIYLENTRSLAKTSDIIFIHRNTVRYRINKCMELLNSDFEDGNEVFCFILSLRILEYERKLSSFSSQSNPSALPAQHKKSST